MYQKKHVFSTTRKRMTGLIDERYLSSGDYVVLLHGIGRSYRSMSKIANYFVKQHYHVLNVDYPGTHFTLEHLIDDIYLQLQPWITQENKQVHLITHSMGGLIARGMINRYQLNNIGRVVMLGPPNHGSEVADLLQGLRLYQFIYGPAGQQLTTAYQHQDDSLGQVTFPLGIIAGDRSLLPFFSLFVLPGSDDGLVSVESSRIVGMSDHIIMHANHALMMQNKKIIRQTLNFIRDGHFVHDETTVSLS